MRKFLEENYPKDLDPDFTRNVITAFEAARSSSDFSAGAREILAKRIIKTAQNGECDPVVLCNNALAHLQALGLQNTA